jgi:sulfatase maturation enzyme AslB (radical SAM superfamily)
MCHQEWSSFVANERYQAGLIDYQIKYKDNIDIALDTIDNLPDLCSVSFIGGEFFLVDNNIKILEKIKQRKLTATITTNATVMNQPMIDILKEINDVEIRISVDGVEDGFEFIRYPANWNTWQNNVNYLRQQLPHADICCSAVFQLLNCQQIHELYEWANRSKITLAHQMLSQPHSLRFSVLDSTERALLGQLLIDKQQQKYLRAKMHTFRLQKCSREKSNFFPQFFPLGSFIKYFDFFAVSGLFTKVSLSILPACAFVKNFL